MPCRFASSGTVATSRSASRAILALNAASNFLRDLVISVLHRLRQSRTLHTLTFGPISGVHFKSQGRPSSLCGLRAGTTAFDGECATSREALWKWPVRLRRPARFLIFRSLNLFNENRISRVLRASRPSNPNLTTGSAHHRERDPKFEVLDFRHTPAFKGAQLMIRIGSIP